MKTVLGLPGSDRELREHVARCRKCQTRLLSLEKEIQTEAIELQEQRATFALQTETRDKKRPAERSAALRAAGQVGRLQAGSEGASAPLAMQAVGPSRYPSGIAAE